MLLVIGNNDKGMIMGFFFIYIRSLNCITTCRIDRNGVIKVADFGLTEDMYGTNYYRCEKSDSGSDEKVPIRWMAPESIENGIYNAATDTVSSSYFGS